MGKGRVRVRDRVKGEGKRKDWEKVTLFTNVHSTCKGVLGCVWLREEGGGDR